MSYTVLVLGGDARLRSMLEVAFEKAAPHIRLCIVPGLAELRSHLASVGVYANREAYPVPHIILVDLDATEGGGLELLELRNATPSLKQIPVMILTSGGESAGVIDEAYARGANSCLLKSADQDSLQDLARGIGAYAMLLKAAAN
jgi:CheY-like chemotaxis protein